MFRQTAIALIALSFSAAPVATAQAPVEPVVSFTASPQTIELEPEAEQVSFGFSLSWSCSRDELAAWPNPINWAIGSGNWSDNVVITPGHHAGEEPATDPTDCVDSTVRHSIDANSTALARSWAQAFVPITQAFNATMFQDGPAGTNNHWGPFETNITFVPKFVAELSVSPLDYRLSHDVRLGRPANVTVYVRNYGNGDGVLEFELVENASSPLNISLPEDLDLPYDSMDDSVVQIQASIAAGREAGTAGKAFPFTVRFVLRSADPRGEATETQEITFLLYEVRRSVPGPDPTAALAVIVLSLVWAARKRAT